MESGDINKVNNEYVVTGKAISTMEKYEEDERRHSDSVRRQRKMVYLTVLILVAAIVQAEVIKVPTLFDFSKIFDSKKAHSQHVQADRVTRGGLTPMFSTLKECKS